MAYGDTVLLTSNSHMLDEADDMEEMSWGWHSFYGHGSTQTLTKPDINQISAKYKNTRQVSDR